MLGEILTRLDCNEQIFFEGWSLKILTSAYLFRIAKKEKSCDYLLIIYMKKIRDSLT